MKPRGITRSVLLFIFFFISPIIFVEAKDMVTLKLSSPAFKHNDSIPSKYTCDGADVNPPLVIENTPLTTKSLALIVDDPDAPAGNWVHWVVWNIDPTIVEIRENTAPSGALQGINDFRKHDYGGPCPPSGTHRYFFKLYALDMMLNLGPKANKAELERAMKGHIIVQGELIGLYRRR
ncbi:MAG TPA: YbhB/YbcL family Raf kinase inhibitor-like protein [Nitrospirota bacterium]|nr:YbhB/YbcL family Raf kinase inhibitor-like protein [Nitrospirota bacterium]